MPTREEIAERNRARSPEFAAFVDDFKRVFGPGVKVRYFNDGKGYVVGDSPYDENGNPPGVQVSAPQADMQALKEEEKKLAADWRRRGRA